MNHAVHMLHCDTPHAVGKNASSERGMRPKLTERTLSHDGIGKEQGIRP
jgi:hypothetical protein